MSTKIIVRKGIESAIPSLAEGEFGFCTDSKLLFIGGSAGNVRLANESEIADLQTALSSQGTTLQAAIDLKADLSALTAHEAAAANSYLSKAVSYPLTTSDKTVGFDATSGNLIATLPTAVGNTNIYTILKTDLSSHSVSIATTSSQTINGRASLDVVLAQQNDRIQVQSDGANWIVISKIETAVLTASGGNGFASIGDANYGLCGTNVVLGIGKWRTKVDFYINNGTATGAAININSGLYASDGANNTSVPTALSSGTHVKAVLGEPTLTNYGTTYSWGGGGVTNTNMRFFAGSLEVTLVVAGGTATVYAVPQIGISSGGSGGIDCHIQAWRID